MDKDVPDAIHGKAIDIACEDDRVWFERHPHREYRLREVVPFEFNGPITAPPDGMTWMVLVAQIKDGIRVRTPVGLPSELPTEGADDSHLAQIFKQVAPEKVQNIVKAAKRQGTK